MPQNNIRQGNDKPSLKQSSLNKRAEAVRPRIAGRRAACHYRATILERPLEPVLIVNGASRAANGDVFSGVYAEWTQLNLKHLWWP